MQPDPLEQLAADAHAYDAVPGDSSNPLVELIESPPSSGDLSAGGLLGQSFLEFYGLQENPFADSVNPAFFYQTEGHRDAFQRMMMAVEQDVSLAMVTGLSGTGKTLITQLLLQHLDLERIQPVLVLVTPRMSRTALLREILGELNVALPVGINRTQDLLKLLSHTIIDLYHDERKLVLLFDECHFLTAENLHIIRTITNIEVPERKLTTCILFGESRFAARLRHSSFDSLRNRMFIKSELMPMNAGDCEQYIKYRCMVGGSTVELFDGSALEAIHLHSGGVCRNVNKLCMFSLMEGYVRRKQVIDVGHIERCVAQM